MKKGIKFHSIYYRFTLFMLMFFTMVIYFLSGGGDIIIVGHLFNSTKLCTVLNIIWIVMFVVFSFVFTKCVISKDGIYLKKIDLTVPWEDISNITYTWINELSLYRHECSFYNVKTMVVYRYDYKPICISNISVLSLFAVKYFSPKSKVDIAFPVLTTLFNVGLNVSIFHIGYTTELLTVKVKPELFFTFLGLYCIKSIILPIVMLKLTNMRYGNYLRHGSLRNHSNPDTINI